jgi:hypothetical protein
MLKIPEGKDVMPMMPSTASAKPGLLLITTITTHGDLPLVNKVMTRAPRTRDRHEVTVLGQGKIQQPERQASGRVRRHRAVSGDGGFLAGSLVGSGNGFVSAKRVGLC